MKPMSRRALITSGLAAAGVAGLAAANRLAGRHGLIPPDCRGIYGPGETLTYATQRILTRHAMAREFPRNMISKMPFALSEIGPKVSIARTYPVVASSPSPERAMA